VIEKYQNWLEENRNNIIPKEFIKMDIIMIYKKTTKIFETYDMDEY
jgi:hypothetical protein